jgi:hypothetical protein
MRKAKNTVLVVMLMLGVLFPTCVAATSHAFSFEMKDGAGGSLIMSGVMNVNPSSPSVVSGDFDFTYNNFHTWTHSDIVMNGTLDIGLNMVVSAGSSVMTIVINGATNLSWPGTSYNIVYHDLTINQTTSTTPGHISGVTVIGGSMTINGETFSVDGYGPLVWELIF